MISIFKLKWKLLANFKLDAIVVSYFSPNLIQFFLSSKSRNLIYVISFNRQSHLICQFQYHWLGGFQFRYSDFILVGFPCEGMRLLISRLIFPPPSKWSERCLYIYIGGVSPSLTHLVTPSNRQTHLRGESIAAGLRPRGGCSGKWGWGGWLWRTHTQTHVPRPRGCRRQALKQRTPTPQAYTSYTTVAHFRNLFSSAGNSSSKGRRKKQPLLPKQGLCLPPYWTSTTTDYVLKRSRG